jgi:hypothetical protein
MILLGMVHIPRRHGGTMTASRASSSGTAAAIQAFDWQSFQQSCRERYQQEMS